MKRFFVFLVLCIFLSVGVLAEDVNKVGDWWGKVTINGVENNGAVVSAYINNVHVGSAVVGQYTLTYYLIHIEGNVGDEISFKVSGVQATTTQWSNGDHPRLDLAVTYTPSTPASGVTPSNTGGTSSRRSSSPSSSSACTEAWKCSEWSECASPGTQTRVCIDTNACGTTKSKPAESQDCKLTEQTTSTSFLTGAVTGISNFVKSGEGIATLLVLLTTVVVAIAITSMRKKKLLNKKDSEIKAE